MYHFISYFHTDIPCSACSRLHIGLEYINLTPQNTSMKELHHVSVKRSEDPSIACAFNMMNIERLYDSSKGRVTGRWEAYLHVSVCLSVSLFNSSCVGCRTFFVPYSKDSCGWLIRVCIPQVYLRGETFYYTLSLKSMTNYFLFSLSFSQP